MAHGPEVGAGTGPVMLWPMRFSRWQNPSLPQTLQIAILLLYISAAFGVLFGAVFSLLGLVIVGGSVLAGLGMANMQRWGYYLGLAVSVLGVLPYVLIVAAGRAGDLFGVSILISMIFDVARLALLLHPESRSYQRIWFEPSKRS